MLQSVFEENILLSLCVPTFNRATLLRRLLLSIDVFENIELVIVDDGSTDDTEQCVQELSTRFNIRYVKQANAGVSHAMNSAYKNASGQFVMKMDSDDYFVPGALQLILQTLTSYRSEYQCFVFGVVSKYQDNERIVVPPSGRSNFMELRADEGVRGDLKEIYSRTLALQYMPSIDQNVRRVPPSLLLMKIAEFHDCLALDKAVVVKDYLEDGVSANIRRITVAYPLPMAELYNLVSRSPRYRSRWYRLRSRLLFLRYSLHARCFKQIRLTDVILLPLAFVLYIKDKL